MSYPGGPSTPGPIPPPPGSHNVGPPLLTTQTPTAAYGAAPPPKGGWPGAAKALVAVFAALAVVAAGLAVVGFSSGSSKDDKVHKLQADVADAQDQVKKLQRDNKDLEQQSADLRTQLDAANSKLADSPLVKLTEIAAAPMSDVAVTAKVLPDSCTGLNTCPKDNVVKLTFNCGGTTGSCTISVENADPVPLAFDGTSYKGSGPVPSSVGFTCDGTDSPTTFEVTAHVDAVAVDSTGLTAAGVAGQWKESAPEEPTCTASSITFGFSS